MILDTSKPLYSNGHYEPLSVRVKEDKIESCVTIKADCKKCVWRKCCGMKGDKNG